MGLCCSGHGRDAERGGTVYLFASRYEAATGVGARTVLLTSTCSVVTIWVLLVLMGS